MLVREPIRSRLACSATARRVRSRGIRLLEIPEQVEVAGPAGTEAGVRSPPAAVPAGHPAELLTRNGPLAEWRAGRLHVRVGPGGPALRVSRRRSRTGLRQPASRRAIR